MNRQLVFGVIVLAAVACGPSKDKGDQDTVRELRAELALKDKDFSESRQESERQIAELKERAERLEAEVNDTTAENEALAAKHAELERVQEELRKKEAELAALNERTSELDAAVAKLESDLKSVGAELDAERVKAEGNATRLAELEKKKADLESQLAAKQAELAKTFEQLSAKDVSLKELGEKMKLQETKLTELNGQIKDLTQHLTEARDNSGESTAILDLEKQLSKLREELKMRESDLEKTRMEATKVLQGLWSIKLKKTNAESKPCRLFVKWKGLSFQKAIICGQESARDDKTFQASYEAGSFDRFELYHEGHVVDFQRRIFVKPVKSSCTATSYLGTTKSFAWSAGVSAMMAMGTSTEEIDGLARNSSNGTATCEEILANPNRVGLALDVMACRLFAMDDGELEAKEQLGCLTAGSGRVLQWQRSAVKPVSN